MNVRKTVLIIFLIMAVFVLSFSLFCAIKGYTPQYVITRGLDKISATVSNRQIEILNEDNRIVVKEWTKGYKISFPTDFEIDTSKGISFIKAYNDNISVTVTREWAPYEDVLWYIDNYQNNYILNEHYQKENNVILLSNERFKFNGLDAVLINAERMTDSKIEHKNNYTYFYVLSEMGNQAFFRIMVKTSDYENNKEIINNIINSFEEISIKGAATYDTKHKPLNKKFNKETYELLNSIKKSDKIKWGIFVDGAYTKDDELNHLLKIEKDTSANFEFSLHYVNLDGKFPTDELDRMYKQGKITELTLQISNHYNSDLFGKNPNFDVYDGKSDDLIRSFAKQAKEFGHPFLFRLNNEMNSDWVNYSGVAALSDPEIFVTNWQRIYNIFKEEQVDNAIWIFNPNNEDCPPSHWNSYLAYYPGDEYVDMIGLTGYNTGTYYREEFNETWRTFDEIYKEPYDRLMKNFSDFPFIITEFASSSVGGDKPRWILNMFDSIKHYKNIKMALWWSSRDYDYRDETFTLVARPYFLDENTDTINAFKTGMQNYIK